MYLRPKFTWRRFTSAKARYLGIATANFRPEARLERARWERITGGRHFRTNAIRTAKESERDFSPEHNRSHLLLVTSRVTGTTRRRSGIER